MARKNPDVIRREYAGKWIARTEEGRIVAVAHSVDAAERKAKEAGSPMVAVLRIPKGRMIG